MPLRIGPLDELVVFFRPTSDLLLFYGLPHGVPTNAPFDWMRERIMKQVGKNRKNVWEVNWAGCEKNVVTESDRFISGKVSNKTFLIC